MGYIDTTFVKQYSDNIMFAVQQKGSRFRGAVREEVLRGEEGFFDTISSVSAAQVTDDFTAGNMHPTTVYTDTEFTRRRVSQVFLRWADLIESKDVARMLVDPTSHYVQAGSWAITRGLDDLIIAAATGTAYAGKTGTTAVSLPSSNIITDGGKGMTIDKLIQAKEILDAADVDPEEPRFLAMTSRQFSDLLKTTEVTSADYDTVKALVRGEINTFLGFTFIRSERLATKTAEDTKGTDNICFAWTYEGLLLAMTEAPKVRVTENPERNFATEVFIEIGAGATRMDERRVVEIDCERL